MIGRQISHFYLIRTLGTGGMGVVYEAQDTRLPRSVAIKVLKEDLSKNVDAVRRFKREARLASSLNHPNICTILEVSEDESQSFIAMELLEGTSLKSRLLGKPVALDEIVDITSQVADALGAAHEQGIIHRDITPGNIFLTAGGLVKLLDFGLAKHFPVSAGDGQTTDDLTNYRCRRRNDSLHVTRAAGGDARSITAATSLRSASCCIRWPPAPVRSTSSRGARSARPSSASRTCRCGSWRRTIPCNSSGSSTRCSRRIRIRRYQSAGTLRADLDALRRG